MALTDNAVLNVTTGHFYLAPLETPDLAAPADLNAIDSYWSEIGHTSLDNVFTVTSEGGEQTVLGTLQAKTLRTSTANRVESFAINLQQFDVPSLKLYFGSNAQVADFWVAVPDSPVATQSAFLAVFEDGEERFGIYAAKAEIKRGDDFSIADTSSFASLPITITPLSVSGSTSKYSVSALGQ